MNHNLLPLFIFLLSFCSNGLFGQKQDVFYSKIILKSPDHDQLQTLNDNGIYFDHYKRRGDRFIEIVLNSEELAILDQLGFEYRVRIKDMSSLFNRAIEKAGDDFVLDCGLTNFTTGSMNGYHTYEDIIQHIMLMQNLYPALVKVDSIGASLEGRTIYAVKISDNVDQEESDQEGVVYYDALTHAREPISMEATLYYMWYLLENYGANEEVTYLVNEREIYLVPIVNPDGYVFNQITNPGGGGFWRKNRRNSGNNCFGVDLNRNYGFGYGLTPGSSSDPCNNTYRGEGAFSEPESAAVRDFVASINPSIAFSIHTFGDVFLSPFGYADILADYSTYAEFVSEFIPEDYRGYGTTAKMLGYTSSGTTRDYLHSEGIYAWTPEIGGEFWEPPTNICPLVQEFLKPMKYLSWVSGPYTCFHDLQLRSDTGFWRGDTLSFDIRLKNRGLEFEAQSVTVTVNSLNNNVTPLINERTYGNIPLRTMASNSEPFSFLIEDGIELLEEVELEIIVRQNGSISYTDNVVLTAGKQNVLFFDDAESGMVNWTQGGFGHNWDTTAMDRVSGDYSFCDSDMNNYEPNTQNWISMMWSVDLIGKANTFVEYNAKWSLERDSDFGILRASVDNGLNWFTLSTANQVNSPGGAEYTRNKHWVQEKVDLRAFADSEILLGFLLTANGNVHGDGFYFDDFKIVDYEEGIMTTSTNELSELKPVARLYPNPNEGNFNLEVTSKTNTNAIAKIYSIEGKRVARFNVRLSKGKEIIQINIPELASGNYVLRLSSKKYDYPGIQFVIN